MKKKAAPKPIAESGFESLVVSIVQIHQQAQEFATKAVNVGLTLRNWLIGMQIEVYERQGTDRSTYGDKLMDALAGRLKKQGWERCVRRELYRFRQLFLTYPNIVESLSPQSHLRPELQPLLAHLPSAPEPIWQSVTTKSPIVETASPQLIQRLSKNKAKLSAKAHAKAETFHPTQIIRDPYLFEFLGLRSRDVMGETDLEDALIDRLQDFLLEMGHGFCFEARQKRILIGDEHFLVDLVFYHRILKCHVLVELKTAAFAHEHLGQLNTYVAYYKQHEMTPSDQPPIGILLCTRKNEALVEFALGDLPNKLFVSRYAVEMPKKQEMEAFLKQLGKELAS
jgi:predicted nuclease of restriction endonuclease-like (RecB) superfamily